MKTLQERFETKYKEDPKTGCWLWMGAKTRGGYGHIRYKVNGQWSMRRAHRVAYELYKGELETGKVIMHKCDNPKCVNPDHLKQGTHHENSMDMVNKGRCGHSLSRAKITMDDARKIRHLYHNEKLKQREIAVMYNLKRNSISLIVNNERWKEDQKIRCKICDQLLNEWESVRKDPMTGEYLDTCGYCHTMSKPEVIDKVEEEDGYLANFTSSDKYFTAVVE